MGTINKMPYNPKTFDLDSFEDIGTLWTGAAIQIETTNKPLVVVSDTEKDAHRLKYLMYTYRKAMEAQHPTHHPRWNRHISISQQGTRLFLTRHAGVPSGVRVEGGDGVAYTPEDFVEISLNKETPT
jgi:hypothetical protein